MQIISKAELANLSKIQGDNCISIYIPTHRGGLEVNEYHDAKLLKSHLDSIKKQMKEEGYPEVEANKILRKGYDLVEDTTFWHHQWNGLAIFLTPDFFQYYKLPYEVEASGILTQSLFLKPLIPALESSHKYYVLGLSMNRVRLFHADENYIHEIDLEEKAPHGLRDILKYYDFEKNLIGKPGGSPNYQGQGASEEPKDYLKEYFKNVHAGVATMIAHENYPVVLACVDYMHPIFKAVNQKLNITEEGIFGSPDDLKPSALHEKSWEIVGKQFEKEKEDVKLTYKENLGTGKASYDINEVLQAAQEGRVQSLILSKNNNIWGINKNGDGLEIHQQFKRGDYCLDSKAALQVLFHGGNVYMEDSPEIQDNKTGSGTAAVFRY